MAKSVRAAEDGWRKIALVARAVMGESEHFTEAREFSPPQYAELFNVHGATICMRWRVSNRSI